MIYARLVTVLVIVAVCVLPGRITVAEPARSAPSSHVVVIVLDGARPDYFSLVPMPHLRSLVEHGISYENAFVGQEPANTPPSHATIGTGLFPDHHGVQGFVWQDPRTGAAIRPADNPAVLNGALEQILTLHHVPSIASAVKAAYPGARVLTASGHKCYAADALGTARADYILCALIYHDRWVAQAVTNHRPPKGAINNPAWDVPIPSPHSGFAPAVEQWNLGVENSWTVSYALWTLRHADFPQVMMLNLPETDVTGHFATNVRAVEGALMSRFDRDLGAIVSAYRSRGLLSRTTFIVTADHGMTRVSQRLPFADLDEAIQGAGGTKVYMEADTGALVGLKDPRTAREVARQIAVRGGALVDATYYKTFSHRRWSFLPAVESNSLSLGVKKAYRTLVNTDAAPEGPDVIAVYAPHVTTGDRPIRGYHWVAGHLGPQWDEQHIPLVISGAGVVKGRTSNYPARLVDLAPTIEALLGVHPQRTDGIVLSDALIKGAPSARRSQGREGGKLLPVIRALRRRSGE